MTFNGIILKDLGIIVQFVNGILDMPKRKGETEYDWGDVIEPLVSADDIYFGSREIVVDAFFDGRKGDFEAAMEPLRQITTTEVLETEYGNYNVRLDKVQVLKNYKQGKSLKITFQELNPELSSDLPTTTGNSSVRIDGMDLFVNFGMLIENTILHEIAELKTSSQTTFKNNFLSVYRKPQELNIKLNGIYASKAEMTSKVQALNALLAEEGLRHFIYHGDGFHCYLTDGCKVNIKRKRVVLTLKLKVSIMYNLQEIVDAVVDQVNIQTNPQSSLAVTDTTDPAYIHGKDTFVAEDSKKLGGNLPDFFGKEAEIKALRDKDLASDLETQTNF